jgi:hypothetical protein
MRADNGRPGDRERGGAIFRQRYCETGRILEPVSGEIGLRVTFRIAEIPMPKPGDTGGPHLHRDSDECIYV